MHAGLEDERLPAARESSFSKVGRSIVELGTDRHHHHVMMSSAGPSRSSIPDPQADAAYAARTMNKLARETLRIACVGAAYRLTSSRSLTPRQLTHLLRSL